MLTISVSNGEAQEPRVQESRAKGPMCLGAAPTEAKEHQESGYNVPFQPFLICHFEK